VRKMMRDEWMRDEEIFSYSSLISSSFILEE